MPENEAGGSPVKRSRSARSALLTLAVHANAVMREPRRYATAAWWRLRGKRLRAKAQFAPLLGMSPHAYPLWLAWQEGSTRAYAAAPPPSLRILALVEPNRQADDIERTLRSLRDAKIEAIVLGEAELAEASPEERIRTAAGKIDWTPGLWLLPLRAGDVLAPGALHAYGAALAGSQACIAYADDDLLGRKGERFAPHFKPDWNSELFRHFDYIGGACILRAEKADLLAASTANDWLRELVASQAAKAPPLHVPQILHHRQSRPQPLVPAVAVPDAADSVSVSVVVPTRNRVDLLRSCIEGLARTDYPLLDVLVVDNDSDDPETLAYLMQIQQSPGLPCRVLRHAGAFNFSALNNRAVREARGEVLCLLNNDIEVTDPGWLAVMVRQALRDDVGAVGARLLYPDGRIQHAGVVVGVGGGAGHAHRFVSPADAGYFRRHELPQFVSAVTAACLVVKRDRYLAVGGLDEESFAVSFNDVDLCLRLNQGGWQSLYEPRATLIHHESVSRGHDRDPIGAQRLAGELAALKRAWGTDDIVDPFHHPLLSRYSEQFAIGL